MRNDLGKLYSDLKGNLLRYLAPYVCQQALEEKFTTQRFYAQSISVNLLVNSQTLKPHLHDICS